MQQSNLNMGFKKPVTENIKHNDLVSLISTTFSIDQFKSKLGSDENVIVVAFKVLDQDPASDLSQFLETGHDVLDIDISTGPDEEGKYSVFVELERDSAAFEKIDAIIADVIRADNEFDNPRFTSYEVKVPKQWSKENFELGVISNSYDYVIKHNPGAKEIKERIKFLNDY